MRFGHRAPVVAIAVVLVVALTGDVVLAVNRSGSHSTSTAARKTSTHPTPKPSATPTKPVESPVHLAFRVGRAATPTAADLPGWKRHGRLHEDTGSGTLGVACDAGYPHGFESAASVELPNYGRGSDNAYFSVIAWPDNQGARQDVAFSRTPEARRCLSDDLNRGYKVGLGKKGRLASSSVTELGRPHYGETCSALRHKARLQHFISSQASAYVDVYGEQTACSIGRLEVIAFVFSIGRAQSVAFTATLMHRLCDRAKRQL